MENLDATKYLIKAKIEVEGVAEGADVIGALFGQTEGLLGEDLDLRDLQRSSKIGRITVKISSERGVSSGTIGVPSCLDMVETSLLAAAIETVDRVGPCRAKIKIDKIEDVRANMRKGIAERARGLLDNLIKESKGEGVDLLKLMKENLRVKEAITYGEESLTAGPNISKSDSIIVVEGRSDVLNLLRCGIKNVIAVDGTNIPQTVADLTKEKTTTAFVDGDRGGELILKELLERADIDFVARAPQNVEVEEMSEKQIVKALRNKVPATQYLDIYGIKRKPPERKANKKGEKRHEEKKKTHEEILEDLSGTLKARILNREGKIIKEVSVRDIVGTLRNWSKKSEEGESLVFDGIITQRILDLAVSSGIKRVVGVKMGGRVKQPASIEVLVKD